MIHNAKDLSPTQKSVLEALLGRRISEQEAISIRAASHAEPPDWLEKSWQTAQQAGASELSMDEIDSEIAAARSARNPRE